jgi:hypothetical protein
MTNTTDLASHFTSANLDQAKVRAFADHVSKVQAGASLKPVRVLTNGIPPVDQFPAVEYHVPREKLVAVIEKLLSNPSINPNILINGIPSNPHLNVTVMGQP